MLITGRGFQRSYSLIIIMKDRMYLQHLWSFLSTQMSAIAANIKAEAERKFESDMREKGLASDAALHSTASPTSPEFFSPQNTSTRDNFQFAKRTSSSSKQVRGLIELCDDEHIFAKLHMWFTWILRTSSCRISERFVQASLPEDSLVALERERQFNEFKVKDCFYLAGNMPSEVDGETSKVSSSCCNVPGGGLHVTSVSLDLNQSYDLELSQLVVENLRQMIKVSGFFSVFA